MTKGIRNNSCQEGGIYEQFVYLLKLGAYPNSSDMNKLYEMAGERWAALNIKWRCERWR